MKNKNEILIKKRQFYFSRKLFLYTLLISISLGFSSKVIGQKQLNIDISTFGSPINGSSFYTDGSNLPIKSIETYEGRYISSKYLNIGFGYVLLDKLYSGIETAIQSSKIQSSNYIYYNNEFPQPEGWVTLGSWAYSKYYTGRIGLRSTYTFMPNEIFRPFVSGAIHYARDFSWVEEGSRTIVKKDEYLDSPYKSTYKINDSHLHYDIRIGGSFHFKNNIVLALAFEVSSSKVNLSHLDTDNDLVKKFEIGIPISLQYRF